MNLAIFDVDGTLFSFDTQKSLIKYIYNKGLMSLWDVLYMIYVLLTMKYRKNLHMPFLKKISPKIVHKYSSDYYKSILKGRISRKIENIIKKHKDDDLLLLSASPNLIVDKIAKDIGAKSIASVPQMKNGKYTGYYDMWVYGENKLKLLREFLKGKKYDKIYFYSDSYSDMPVFDFVDVRVAVNPDKRLRKIAKEKGWEIIYT